MTIGAAATQPSDYPMHVLPPPPGQQQALGAPLPQASTSGAAQLPPPPPPRSSLQDSLRSEVTGTPPAISASATAADQARLATMHDYVNAQFAPFKDGSNDAAIDALASGRAQGLHEDGYTPDKLKSMFSFANAVDATAAVLKGGSGALGFSLANGIGGQLLPRAIANPAGAGALSGFLTHLLVHFGGNVNGTMTAHTPWQRPGLEDLEPAMQQAVIRMQPDMKQQFKETGGKFQGYPLTFATVGELPAAVHAADPAAGAKLATGWGQATAFVAGLFVGGLDHGVDKAQHRNSPALMLGSTEWRGLLGQLEQTGAVATLAGGRRQLSEDMLGKLSAGIVAAAGQLKQPSTWLGNAVWTGGLAASNFATAKLTDYMQHQGFSGTAIMAANQLVFAGSLMPINAAWSALLTLGPMMDKPILDGLQKMWGATPETVAAEAAAVSGAPAVRTTQRPVAQQPV